MKKPFQQDDALLADINATRDLNDGSFRVWWLGQSGFLLQFNGKHLLFDPYLSDSLTDKYAQTDKPHARVSERVIDPARLDFIDYVTSSHNHTDHLDARTLCPLIDHASRRNRQIHIVVPEANRDFVADRLGLKDPMSLHGLDSGQAFGFPYHITAVPAAHNTIDRDDGGRCRYLGYVVRFRNWTLYHSGDTLLYPGMADLLRPFKIDLALLPINGNRPERRVAGNLNGREAAQLARDIGAKLVIPCHYDMFKFNTADPADEFIPHCEHIGQACRVLRQGEQFSSAELPR